MEVVSTCAFLLLCLTRALLNTPVPVQTTWSWPLIWRNVWEVWFLCTNIQKPLNPSSCAESNFYSLMSHMCSAAPPARTDPPVMSKTSKPATHGTTKAAKMPTTSSSVQPKQTTEKLAGTPQGKGKCEDKQEIHDLLPKPAKTIFN